MAQSMLKSFLTSFFTELEQRSIQFCVLRNYENLPEYTSNDVDILVSRTAFKQAVKLLYSVSLRIGLRLHMHVEHACHKMVFHSTGNSHFQCHIDLYGDLTWKGFALADAREVLASRLRYKGFYIPEPAWEHTLNLLTRLIYLGRVKDAYKVGIQRTALHGQQGVRLLSVLIKSLGKVEGRRVWVLAKNAEWRNIEKRSWAVRKALIFNNIMHNPAAVVRRQLAQVARLVRRLYNPAGVSIAVVGPDGAGKTTLLKNLRPVLDMTFSENTHTVHWRPEVFRLANRKQQVPVIDPHGQKTRNKYVSFLFFLYHTLMFILGYWVRLAPLRFRGWAILLDRYFYDFFVDLKRFRLSVSAQLVRLGYFFVPKPDIVFLLDAVPEIIWSRKQEVSQEETVRQCKAYRYLVQTLPNGFIVDANQPEDIVADDVLEIIMDHLSRRVEEQWKSN